jgi:dienelactone hydrolase
MSLGRVLNGERVFDVERALDYLAWRGDVDMKRVGILGQSSGGTISMYAAALLPQIAWCMPCCSTARFADSIASIHHCVCNIVPGIMQWMDMGDILGAIALRPLVIINGKTDDIFPIASARASFRQAKKAYNAAGAGDRVKFVEGPGGHDFYAQLGWDAMLKMIG